MFRPNSLAETKAPIKSSFIQENILIWMVAVIIGAFALDQLLFFISLPDSEYNSSILLHNLAYDTGATVLSCLAVIKISEFISKRFRRDLTLTSKMGVEIEKIKKEWEKTFDSIYDWICIIDKDNKIIRSNRGSEKIVEVSPEDIIGKKCCAILHGTDGPVPDCPFPEMIANRQRASTEVISIKGKWVLVSIDPLINENGDIISAVHIVRDISVRKSYEIEREKLIKKLEVASQKIKTLSGLVPICSICKKVRDDKGYWEQIETYVSNHSEAEFSHALCPECLNKNYPDFYQ